MLRKFAIDVDGLEIEEAKRQGQLQTLVASRCENYDLFTCELSHEVDQVGLLVLGGAEEVGLLERVDCLVLRVNFDLDCVVERGSLQLLHFSSHGG